MKKRIIVFVVITISIVCVLVYNFYTKRNNVLASSSENLEYKISKAEKIEIEEIINGNIPEENSDEYKVEEIILEYTTIYRNNSSLANGSIQVVQEGREGIQEVVIKTTEVEGEIIEEQISSKIIKSSVEKIVEVGTGNFVSKKAKVGDVVYISSDRAELKLEPNNESEKMITLGKDEEVRIEEIVSSWYKVSVGQRIGYVKIESTTTKKEIVDDVIVEENNTNINSNISMSINLSKPSGLSLSQFEKVLTDSKDVNGIFKINAKYFYYMEEQYGINGIFVAAVGVHESAWGTSKISLDKNNLFGYGAYDSDPYNGAYSFDNYAEGIDLVSRVFVKYYLHPKGTSIYGGETAVATYYNGATLSGVNTRYATDKNWANAVFKHMEYLYNKL